MNTAIIAQDVNSIVGKLIDSKSETKIQNADIRVRNAKIQSKSDNQGLFNVSKLPIGMNTIEIYAKGYNMISIPVRIEEKVQNIDLGIILLTKTKEENNEEEFIYLEDKDLLENEKGESNSISGLLRSSKDVFLRTVAYEFSSTFFKPRNLGSENSQVLLNGVNMNKLYNGRPQWSNWGGLNDVLRNQELTVNTMPSPNTFGGALGSINIITQSSKYRKGVKLSYSASNRSYRGRIMASYSSGLSSKGWAYTFSASRRFANEGFREGTLYAANSFFTSIEKKINKKHSFNFTAIYTSNLRGKSSPNTQEVIDLKNSKYNSYWGDQNGVIRNSRVKEIEEPIFQLNHIWNINENTSIQTNITYQFGKVGNSRIDYGGSRIVLENNDKPVIVGGGSNPDPTYYQKLPSYFLRDIDNPDYENAYLAEQEFLKNGQLDWNDLYAANNNVVNNGNSIYALYEDKNDDNLLNVRSSLYRKINKTITIHASLDYKMLQSENYANMLDLLGGTGFLDVDVYADNMLDAQSDLQNPNRIVHEGDRYKYNYNLNAVVINGFIQGQYYSKKWDAYLALNYSGTNYQRKGLFENGVYPGEASVGKSKTLNFNGISSKVGATYKLSGRHIFSANAAFINKAPTLKNSFSNSRENNDIVNGLINEKITSVDLNYFVRIPKINAKVSGYWINIQDQSEVSFYFADGLSGVDNNQTTAFVQEVLTGIDKQNIGLELGLEYTVLPNFKLKGVAALGQSVYASNPNLYLTSDDFKEPLNLGKVSLKDYFISGGPQQAYSFGFEYSSPKYWWFGTAVNYFKNAYVSIAPITRTKNFYLDDDGLPINDFDEDVAKELLRQETFKPYYLVNLVGGKSWKIGDYYVGFFANISNVLNTEYKTGGFEQSRNANYNTLLKDKNREKPLFGPKYWLGYGTSYYTSLYLRF